MSSVIYCPDCGGVISEDVPEGMQRCRCAEASAQRPGLPEPAEKVKICCRCKCDLTGRRRYHDSRGYWCEACTIADRRETETKGTPCASCGRKLDPKKLVAYEGLRICGRCYHDREVQRRKPKAIPASRFRSYELKRVLIGLAIAAVLALVAYLNQRFR